MKNTFDNCFVLKFREGGGGREGVKQIVRVDRDVIRVFE